MNRTKTVFSCIALLTLSACGSDYEANPIVIQDGGGGGIVFLDSNSITPTGDDIAINSFSRSQLLELQSTVWQSDCRDGQIIELTFSATTREQTFFAFDDANCQQRTASTPTTSSSPYTIYEQVQDSTGLDMTRIEFRVPFIDSTSINRSVFAIEQNRLYFGRSTSASLDFASSLDFSMPYYAVSESQQLSTTLAETL